MSPLLLHGLESICKNQWHTRKWNILFWHYHFYVSHLWFMGKYASLEHKWSYKYSCAYLTGVVFAQRTLTTLLGKIKEDNIIRIPSSAYCPADDR